MRRAHRSPAARVSTSLLLPILVSVSLASYGAEPEVERPSLTDVYLFYSEPPFPYIPLGEIKVPLRTVWDREKKELVIREAVVAAGANVAILERSFMEWDSPVSQLVGTPTPRGIQPTILVPTRTAWVVGRLARRIEDAPSQDCVRRYPMDFDPVWAAATMAVSALGWTAEVLDVESRYMATAPVATAEITMECEIPYETWLPAVFTVYVNSCDGHSAVRLDVNFIDPATGTSAPCRSAGVYEAAFFRQLEKRLRRE